MLDVRDLTGRLGVIGIVIVALFTLARRAQAEGDLVLYSFTGKSDGAAPWAGVVADGAGNLYGTAEFGGAKDDGTLFKLAADGTETTLHSLTGEDGAYPESLLTIDKSGNLFGTATAGGAKSTCISGQKGCGTVFEFKSDGTWSVLYTFPIDGERGAFPIGGMTASEAGILYGVTVEGGESRGCDYTGCGVIFELGGKGSEKVLYSFLGGADGAKPEAGLISDAAGNLYGTTAEGGDLSACPDYGCGTVFRITPDGTKTLLYAFKGIGGDDPAGPLILDKSGNLYGTTVQGGGGNCQQDFGCGTVFKIAPDGTEKVLYTFKGGKDGFEPLGRLIRDHSGQLFGTTNLGGDRMSEGCGTVFSLAPSGVETILHTFTRTRDGCVLRASGLVADNTGYLNGTASAGGDFNSGIIFKLER